jgi:hypothetical protein
VSVSCPMASMSPLSFPLSEGNAGAWIFSRKDGLEALRADAFDQSLANAVQHVGSSNRIVPRTQHHPITVLRARVQNPRDIDRGWPQTQPLDFGRTGGCRTADCRAEVRAPYP